MTVEGILFTTKKDLTSIKGLTDAKVEKIKDAAEKLGNTGFITAAEYMEVRNKVKRITTGGSELD